MKATWLVLIVTCSTACVMETSDIGSQESAQLLVPATQAGVWRWTLVTPAATTQGYVVCRGTSAARIGTSSFAQNTETWFSTSTSRGGTAKFEVTLVMVDDPNDAELVRLVDEVDNGRLLGSTAMVPVWTSDPPLSGSVQVHTLTSVTGAPGSYASLYRHVSFAMPDPTQLPTFYSDSTSLTSIFGSGSYIYNEGIKATFTPVSAGGAGYPTASWYFCGRDF